MPQQMPSHVGLFHKLRNRRDKTNSAIDILRNAGYGGGKKKKKKKKK